MLQCLWSIRPVYCGTLEQKLTPWCLVQRVPIYLPQHAQLAAPESLPAVFAYYAVINLLMNPLVDVFLVDNLSLTVQESTQ